MVNLQLGTRVSIEIAPTNGGSSSSSSQALTDKLSQAFTEALEQVGIDPGSIKLTFDTTSGQTSGTSQTNGASSASNSSASSSGSSSSQSTVATPASLLGFNALVPRGVSAMPVAPASAAPVHHWYADNAADDAYWSKQPAPVQQLREIQDLGKREALASQLAGEGYQIDNTIMVWGWDAGQVTAMRQSAGYTWVPSMLQSNVTAAPGITAPGLTPYDPNNPPAGSIKVG